MSNTLPEMGEALEWAKDAAEARRLQTLRYSILCGWHSEFPTPPPAPPAIPQVLRGVAYKWPR